LWANDSAGHTRAMRVCPNHDRHQEWLAEQEVSKKSAKKRPRKRREGDSNELWSSDGDDPRYNKEGFNRTGHLNPMELIGDKPR
jgi:hypothetical protein